jgi:hypothetical protein
MSRGSQRYLVLKRRLSQLDQNLLYFLPPPPHSKTTYTSQELDLTRAYIVLVHAEIEADGYPLHSPDPNMLWFGLSLEAGKCREAEAWAEAEEGRN